MKIPLPIWALACALLLGGLQVKAQTVQPAPEYESAFHRTSGWTGADGTYSYPMAGGLTLWGFSDTFFGEVVGGARQEDCLFLHNSTALQSGSSFTFPPAPVFTPPGDGDTWFWVWDAAEGRDILLGEFVGDGENNGFGFRQVGLWSARFQLSDAGVRVSNLQRLPHFAQRDGQSVTFGPAILETPSWLYLYGVHDKDGGRHSVLARAPRGCLGQAGTWRFYDGAGWNKDLWSVKSLFAGGAMEASVHRTRSGQYLYLGTDAGGMGSSIIARLAPSPEGPWGEPIPISQAPEHQGNVFAYNAKAHPELSKDGRLLISYNVNTSDFTLLFQDAGIYRPRFLWWTPPESGWLPAH